MRFISFCIFVLLISTWMTRCSSGSSGSSTSNTPTSTTGTATNTSTSTSTVAPIISSSTNTNAISNAVKFETINPILSNKCGGSNCHGNGATSGVYVGSESNVQSDKDSILSSIQGGSMPPSSSPALSTSEEQTLLQYLNQ